MTRSPNYSGLNHGERYINVYTTDEAISTLRECIKSGIVQPEKYDSAYIVYDTNKGIGHDPKKIDHYPLRFCSSFNCPTIYISGVTAGYPGEGPHGTLKCLEMMLFDLTEDQKHSVLSKEVHPGGFEDPIVYVKIFK